MLIHLWKLSLCIHNMNLFRSILLWLAFLLVTLQFFWNYSSNVTLAVIYRLLPSIVLLLWFALSVLFKVNVKLKIDTIPKFVVLIFKILRPLSSLTIVTGALIKYNHLAHGNQFLAVGLLFMAINSTIISIYGVDTTDRPNDIIDDQDN